MRFELRFCVEELGELGVACAKEENCWFGGRHGAGLTDDGSGRFVKSIGLGIGGKISLWRVSCFRGGEEVHRWCK